MIIIPFDNKHFMYLKEKIGELGLDDTNIGPIVADLYDLTEASNDFLGLINKLLLTDANNKDDMLDVLIKIQLNMEHFKFHIKSGLPHIKKIINSIK